MKIWKIAQIGQGELPEEQVPELSYEKASEFLEMQDQAYADILKEYHNRKRKKKTMMSWDVIPFARLKKIWQDYSKTGFVRDEKGMQDITDQMIRILSRLNASHQLSGHGNLSEDEIEEQTGYKMPHGKDTDFYFYFLETPYGTPVSDYGLDTLNNLGSALLMTKDPTAQLLLVDRMLMVTHQRGDLSALFIEGGKASLDQLQLA